MQKSLAPRRVPKKLILFYRRKSMERNLRKRVQDWYHRSQRVWEAKSKAPVRPCLKDAQLHGEEEEHEDHRRDGLHLVRCRRGRNGPR